MDTKLFRVYNEPILDVYFDSNSPDYDEFVKFCNCVCPQKTHRYVNGYKVYCVDDTILTLVVKESDLFDNRMYFTASMF
jgi:hypothetical protein